MPIINNILTTLALASLFLMIAGLIRPALVLTLSRQKTRLRVLTIFGGPFLSLALAASATGPLLIKQPKEDGHEVFKGQIPAAFQTEAASIEPRESADNKEATERDLMEFLQKNEFKKDRALYIHYPDPSHPLRPYMAVAYRYDSKGLKYFTLDNWYSDPAAAATLPVNINRKLETMEELLLSEMLGNGLGKKLASIRRDLIFSESGDVFWMTLNGRKLYGFVTSGGGSIAFMDEDSPLGEGRNRKTPKRII
ncbi:MAG: hypothetical protein C4576_27520 [Desulfobacteraceae bacterium]|nr:MAG: hypothetical protein C4576_27520 [Desulfobacteraceae bacterium]